MPVSPNVVDVAVLVLEISHLLDFQELIAVLIGESFLEYLLYLLGVQKLEFNGWHVYHVALFEPESFAPHVVAQEMLGVLEVALLQQLHDPVRHFVPQEILLEGVVLEQLFHRQPAHVVGVPHELLLFMDVPLLGGDDHHFLQHTVLQRIVFSVVSVQIEFSESLLCFEQQFLDFVHVRSL